MKKLLCLTFLASAAVMMPVKAANLPAPVIGIVEQAILDKSAAFQSILKQMEQKRSEIQKEMSSYEKSLKEENDKLTKEQKNLSEKDLKEKSQAFEKRVHEVQEKLEIRRAQMELAAEEAKKKVYEAFLKVSEEVRKTVGANIILYKETIVTADEAFDVTREVLEKLNKALPTVQVNFKSEAEVRKQLQQATQS